LSERYAERLGGMSVTSSDGEDPASAVTTLVGRLRDQAELSGVLNTLYDLHLPILEVEKLPNGGSH
jgi:hypothetical protein